MHTYIQFKIHYQLPSVGLPQLYRLLPVAEFVDDRLTRDLFVPEDPCEG